jgi:hypothetical protein
VEVAEQPEAGHVGGSPDTGCQRRRRSARVQGGHRRDRVLEDLAGRLVPVVEHPDPEWFRQCQRRSRRRGVVAQQPVGIGDPGDGHPVERFGGVDAVAADDGAARLLRDVEPALEDAGGELGWQHVTGPAEQVDRDDGGAAGGVDVGQGVRRSDPSEVDGVIDHRAEEVGGRQDSLPAHDPDDRAVVTVVEPDDHLRPVHLAQPGDHRLQLTRWDLARTAPAVGESGEPDGGDIGHGHRLDASCGRLKGPQSTDTQTLGRTQKRWSRRSRPPFLPSEDRRGGTECVPESRIMTGAGPCSGPENPDLILPRSCGAQIGWTSPACGPFWPCVTSNSTRCPSSRLR